MDLIVGIPTTAAGYRAIIVFIDRLTKRANFESAEFQDTAVDTATIYFETIFCHHCLPRIIIRTKTSLSTALHLQTDGQGETLNRTVEEMLRHYSAQQPEKWDETLTHQ
ncbi:unnamed protein product [Didymodactylos carnosus]|uniref:Integrase catalytic domain-containing protein n=1 Tax=Didymodactylos carnosus TaxID=1234261 RepID=A0A815YAA5_9BILA|nr:unnamed protein product [Didymodactylos carnosus]CAF4431643.1 unnamed protein product [Didymodactylos carnosus]